jgi:hypothetical protein
MSGAEFRLSRRVSSHVHGPRYDEVDDVDRRRSCMVSSKTVAAKALSIALNMPASGGLQRIKAAP